MWHSRPRLCLLPPRRAASARTPQPTRALLVPALRAGTNLRTLRVLLPLRLPALPASRSSAQQNARWLIFRARVAGSSSSRPLTAAPSTPPPVPSAPTPAARAEPRSPSTWTPSRCCRGHSAFPASPSDGPLWSTAAPSRLRRARWHRRPACDCGDHRRDACATNMPYAECPPIPLPSQPTRPSPLPPGGGRDGDPAGRSELPRRVAASP